MSYRYKVHRLPPAGKLHFLDLRIIPLVHRFLSMFLKASFRRIFKRLILVSSYHNAENENISIFHRQFSYVTGKNTDKYKAEVNESRQKTALD